MGSSKNAEKIRICDNKSVTGRVSTTKYTKCFAFFSANGEENFPKLNFTQASKLGLKNSFCFKGDDFDSDLSVEFFTFSLNQNNNKCSEEL